MKLKHEDSIVVGLQKPHRLQHHQSQQHHGKKRKRLPVRIATATIGIAIIILLCIHWYLAILHTNNLQPQHDLFLSSFASSSPQRSGRTNASSTEKQQQQQQRPLPLSIKQSLASPIRHRHHRNNNDTDSYITSPICGGCSRSRFDTRQCWMIMHRDRKKLKLLSLLDAATKLGKESVACELCDPVRCWMHYNNNNNNNNNSSSTRNNYDYGGGHASKYWRFDRSNPEFTKPTTLALSSIPDKFRIPPSRFRDIDAYFKEKFEFTKANNISMDYLVEYNPGLAVIPSKMKRHLPKGAAYLVSLRVTPANNCFPSQMYADLPRDVWNAVYMTSTNHLGLALLDEEYRMMPGGYDAVIEMDTQLDLKRSTTSHSGEAVSVTFMDYRIFVLNEEIYLHINADTVILSRISLRAKGFGDDDAYINNIGNCTRVAEEAGGKGHWEKPCRLDNLHGGDNLQVTLMRQFNTVWSGGSAGKNYALFGIPNATHPDEPDSVYAELDIFPHHVQQILPEEFNELSNRQVMEKIWKVGTHKGRHFKIDRVNARMIKEVGNTTESDNVPLPSFSTVDAHEDWFPGQDAPFKEAAHGGACCVSFSAEELNLGGTKKNHRKPLLVGIGHTKVIYKPWYSKAHVPQEKKDRLPHTHYVSLFYAFDPYPPFQIRARSGYFCLGHAPPSSTSTGNNNELPPGEGGVFNPHSILTRNRNLLQNNVMFDCPQMSFVSSFIQKAGDDSSKTVIGYGLNDCTGRLVEVEKSEIVRLLYPDPMDMIFE